tara:strand:+ start:444 stop:623 length:180 start_codon:yes stop_codon:yes gene_type:complete
LNNKNSLENLKPELVEKKDPPIIIRIIKIKVRFWGTSKENPIFDIELQIDKKSEEKLLL